MRTARFQPFRCIIAALTREHDGWGQAAGLITAGARSRVQCLVPARGARRGKALDEVSAAIPRDAVARNNGLKNTAAGRPGFPEWVYSGGPGSGVENGRGAGPRGQ